MHLPDVVAPPRQALLEVPDCFARFPKLPSCPSKPPLFIPEPLHNAATPTHAPFVLPSCPAVSPELLAELLQMWQYDLARLNIKCQLWQRAAMRKVKEQGKEKEKQGSPSGVSHTS